MRILFMLLLMLGLASFTNVALATTPQFPYPIAATFYPIYDDGYLDPTTKLNDQPIPFDKLSALFIAFAHAYPDSDPNDANGSILDFEHGQTDQSSRLSKIIATARQINPKIIIIISLGYGKNDWTYINNDYVTNNATGNFNFPKSLVKFIRDNKIDGFDIDDESVYSQISQTNFNAVVSTIRNALDQAGQQDGRKYYFTVTPANGESLTGEVNKDNMMNFDLINAQTYSGTSAASVAKLGYPPQNITQGFAIDSNNCNMDLIWEDGYGGAFTWSLPDDYKCDFYYTKKYAALTGYATVTTNISKK